MEAITEQIEASVASRSYADFAAVFRSGPYLATGSGERRGLHAFCLRACVASPDFLPGAFDDEDASSALEDVCLRHLPPTMTDGSDNRVRRALYQHLLAAADYEHAARVLGTLRMDDGPPSGSGDDDPYRFSPAERCDVYVQTAECFLMEDDHVAADAAATKAGAVLDGLARDGGAAVPRSLSLRYRSVRARVLDLGRRFVAAAAEYFELSRAFDSGASETELLSLLGRAAACAVLSPVGPQRQSVLGLVRNDDRASSLGESPDFVAHADVLRRACRNEILRTDGDELSRFRSTLSPHQTRVVENEGLSPLDKAVLEHNMIAVSRLYASIRFDELSVLLGDVGAERAEEIAGRMIVSGQLKGNIDGVDGLLNFEDTVLSNNNVDHDTDAILAWDEAITTMCGKLNRVTDMIQGK